MPLSYFLLTLKKKRPFNFWRTYNFSYQHWTHYIHIEFSITKHDKLETQQTFYQRCSSPKHYTD